MGAAGGEGGVVQGPVGCQAQGLAAEQGAGGRETRRGGLRPQGTSLSARSRAPQAGTSLEVAPPLPPRSGIASLPALQPGELALYAYHLAPPESIAVAVSVRPSALPSPACASWLRTLQSCQSFGGGQGGGLSSACPVPFPAVDGAPQMEAREPQPRLLPPLPPCCAGEPAARSHASPASASSLPRPLCRRTCRLTSPALSQAAPSQPLVRPTPEPLAAQLPDPALSGGLACRMRPLSPAAAQHGMVH